MFKENSAQERAIKTIGGRICIVSVPGSGKTTTLIRRINHMEEIGIDPKCILMMTFSKTAARDMKERYFQLYGKETEASFCTIHSFCYSLIKKFRHASINVISQQESERFLYENMKGKGISDKTSFVNDFLLDVSVFKNAMEERYMFTPKCLKDKKFFWQLYDAYEKHKENTDAVDYDDMMLIAYNMLKNEPGILDWVQERYLYFLIDEHQDTNALQKEIIYLLSSRSGNLCVVGDDDQSIYGFRGADPSIMLGFKNDFPSAIFINMNTNYRSGRKILDCANKVIRNNQNRYEKNIDASKEDDGQVEVLTCDVKESQIKELAKRIKALISSGEDPKDIAVLYRTNAEASEVADAFMENEIPFKSNEKVISKYTHWMYSDINAYHNVAEGKSTKFEQVQILNHPKRFLSSGPVYENGLSEEVLINEAFKIKESWKRDNMLKSITALFRMLRKMRDKKPSEVLNLLGEKYLKYAEEYAESRNKNPEDMDNIWEEYKKDIKKTGDSWEGWRKYAEQYNYNISKKSCDPDGVTISTMHRSKGLEWKHVFIINCVDGTMPFYIGKESGDLEEERRLFYVAMTRAKERLYIMYYQRSIKKQTSPTPYLREMAGYQYVSEKPVAILKEGHKKSAPKPSDNYRTGQEVLNRYRTKVPNKK